MGLSTHGVSGDGCVDNHDCFPHVYPHVFHSFQGVIHMLTGGGWGMAAIQSPQYWRHKGERWELGERGRWLGFYAVWGAYMGHVGGSVSIYDRLMQCMSGWRLKGRRMRGLGGEWYTWWYIWLYTWWYGLWYISWYTWLYTSWYT